MRRIEALQRENEELRSACAQQLERMNGKDEAIEKLNAELAKAQDETRTSPGGGGGGRGKAKARVDKECELQEFKFEGVPFFDHFQIRDAKQLKDKLAAFLIARDPDVNTPGKRRTTTNQAKFKADNFVTLLWFSAPGDPPPYEPGDVDGLFEFFCNKHHADMGKKRTFFNHDHRVCAWLSSPLAQHLHLVDYQANFVLGAAGRHGREGGDVLEREPFHVILGHFEFVPEPEAEYRARE